MVNFHQHGQIFFWNLAYSTVLYCTIKRMLNDDALAELNPLRLMIYINLKRALEN